MGSVLIFPNLNLNHQQQQPVLKFEIPISYIISKAGSNNVLVLQQLIEMNHFSKFNKTGTLAHDTVNF